MRILFVLDRVENPASANAQLACRLAEQLLAQGHEIHLLELWDGENPPPAPPAGASQHTLAFADERLMNHALENGAKAGNPVPLRLLRLAAHPTAVAAAFRQLVLHAPRRTVDSRREMERLDAEFHFDAVCAVCAPYRTAFALETAQIGGKTVCRVVVIGQHEHRTRRIRAERRRQIRLVDGGQTDRQNRCFPLIDRFFQRFVFIQISYTFCNLCHVFTSVRCFRLQVYALLRAE